jgi:hypothetical protein
MCAIVLAAAAALAFASTSVAGTTGNGWTQNPAPAAATNAGSYKRDSVGKCQAANGAFANDSLCPAASPTHCKDAKTKKFAKCGTPGAVRA